jgi:RNA polymerase sigma-70 factor (ECF subfamily)
LSIIPAAAFITSELCGIIEKKRGGCKIREAACEVLYETERVSEEGLNDEKLQKLLVSDSEKGMKKLIESCGGLVSAVISGKLLGSRFSHADIEDCAAETFFEFWQGFKASPCRAQEIRPRLCVIAKRNAIDCLRRSYGRPEPVPLEYAEHETGSRDDWADTVDRLELVEAVKALGKPDSEILIRKYYFGQTSAEIADIIGLSAANVDTRAHRALKKLRMKLGGNEDE